jgi:hypothetical protein
MMVTNPDRLEKFERSFQRAEDLPLQKKLSLLDGMYNLAREYGHFSTDKPLEGIETVVRLAASLHSLVRTTPR